MVDISKHLARAKQALERRHYDLAIEITTECQEVDPANLDNYRLLLDAAKRRLKETGKKGGFGLGFGSKDPHKALTAAVKKAAKHPDAKACAAVGDAARAVYESGIKNMAPVSVLFYEEVRKEGLFNADSLWHLGHMYFAVHNDSGEMEPLDNAIEAIAELKKGMPTHQEAGRTLQRWEAVKSMKSRNTGKTGHFSDQLASDKEARRNEVLGRQIRTKEDAEEVLSFLKEDIEANPTDKRLWLKQGDVLRRVSQFARAREAYQKAQEIDPHDFVITINLGDLDMAESEHKIRTLRKAGQDSKAEEQDLLKIRIREYSLRAERQPTEMAHKYNLAENQFLSGDSDAAAPGFQQAKKDPRFKRKSLYYLGKCFAKKGLLDIARDQFSECLEMIQDELSDEFKDTLYNRARINEANKDSDAASADYRKIVEIDLGYKDAADRLAKLKN